MNRSSGPFYIIAILVLIGLLAIDAVSLKNHFTRPEKIRAILKEKLGDSFSFEQSEFNLFNGLKLSDVRLFSGKDDAEEPEPFLRTPRILVDLSVLDLLEGRTTPTGITVYEPDVRIMQNPEGGFNVESFLEEIPEQETGDTPLRTNISIVDGSVTLQNIPGMLRENRTLQVQSFDVDLRPIREGSGLLFDGEGTGSLGVITVRGRFNDGKLSARAIARSLDVRPELIDTFASEIRDEWEKYQLTGTTNLEYQVEYDSTSDTSNPALSQSLTVRPQGMSCSFVDFPYPLENIRGTMQFRSDGLSFELRSAMDGARFSFNGHTEGYGGRSEISVVIHSENVPINDDLYTALEPEPEVKSVVRSMNASGSVNATGYVNRSEGREDVAYSIRVYPQGIDATYSEFPYPVKDVKGTVVIEPEAVRLENIQATPAPSNQASGTSSAKLNGIFQFPEKENQSATIDLNIEASEVPLEQTLKQNLPEQVQNTWTELQPQGTGSLTWSLRQSPASSSPRHEVQASLSNCTFQPVPFDKPIENVTAGISFKNNRLLITDVSGKWNEGTIQISKGEIGTSASEKPFGLFNISGTNVSVNQSLKQLIFEEKTLEEAIQNEGSVDMSGSIRWFEEREDREIEFYLMLNVEGMHFQKILDLENVQGKIVLKGEKDSASEDQSTILTGGVDLSGMNVNGVPVNSYQSNFILRNKKLELHELNGRLLNGNLERGQITLDTAKEQFDINIETSGLDLQKLLTSIGVEERNLSGTLFGRVGLRGDIANKETWTGGGNLQLRNAQLWRLPIFLPVFMELSLSKQEPFTEGMLDFNVKDQNVLVQKMQFESPSSRLTGTGQVGFNGDLLIYLGTKELDSIIPPIPVIGWAYNQITSNLVTFKATGNLSNPSVSATPLPFIFKEKIGN